MPRRAAGASQAAETLGAAGRGVTVMSAGLGLAPSLLPEPLSVGPPSIPAAIIGGSSVARAEAAAPPPVAQTSGGRGGRPVINHPQNASGKRQKQIKQRGNSASSPLMRATLPDDPFCGILKVS